MAKRDQAVDLFNELKLSKNQDEKVDKIKQLTELIVHVERTLLPEFVPEICALQLDGKQNVRNYLRLIWCWCWRWCGVEWSPPKSKGKIGQIDSTNSVCVRVCVFGMSCLISASLSSPHLTYLFLLPLFLFKHRSESKWLNFSRSWQVCLLPF